MRDIEFTKPTETKKGWGKELLLANNGYYCGKLLVYDKPGAESSSHLHFSKEESFFCNIGRFNFSFWDNLGNKRTREFNVGDVIHIPPGCPHRLVCIEPGVIFEVSTHHSDDDVIRIEPGDSQK